MMLDSANDEDGLSIQKLVAASVAIVLTFVLVISLWPRLVTHGWFGRFWISIEGWPGYLLATIGAVGFFGGVYVLRRMR